MLEVIKLSEKDTEELKHLLESDQLCYNDIGEQGVQLFGVSKKHKLIGYFGYELFGNLALFRSMIIAPDTRNKGYGTLIWRLAKEKLQKEGVNEVYLLTNTAGPFFSKQGFEETVRSSAPEPILATTEFKEFCPTGSVCMKLRI